MSAPDLLALGPVELTAEERGPVVELAGAVLCEDCHGITTATKLGACGRCGSKSVSLISNQIPVEAAEKGESYA